jgi:hypothetical protein
LAHRKKDENGTVLSNVWDLDPSGVGFGIILSDPDRYQFQSQLHFFPENFKVLSKILKILPIMRNGINSNSTFFPKKGEEGTGGIYRTGGLIND